MSLHNATTQRPKKTNLRDLIRIRSIRSRSLARLSRLCGLCVSIVSRLYDAVRQSTARRACRAARSMSTLLTARLLPPDGTWMVLVKLS